VNEKNARHLGMLLNLTTFLANHQDVKAETVCNVFGLSRRRLMRVLNEVLMCGVPPYGPSDYVTAWVEGDQVRTVNCDFLRRPLRLTVKEALSLKVVVAEFIRQSPGVFREAASPPSAGCARRRGRSASTASGRLASSTSAWRRRKRRTSQDTFTPRRCFPPTLCLR